MSVIVHTSHLLYCNLLVYKLYNPEEGNNENFDFDFDFDSARAMELGARES